jgi:hypothetical protein
MKILLWFSSILLLCNIAVGQSFELSPVQDSYKGLIGETVKAPLRIKNTTEKSITLYIKKVNTEIGSTQKNYFCLDNACMDQRGEDFSLKLEPGQTINSLLVALESGLVAGESNVHYVIYNKANPTDQAELDLSFRVEEKPEKESIYNSRNVQLHDVYPNPVNDYAFVEYKILNDKIKARIVIHNILGTVISEYALPTIETKIKIHTEELNSGIYFYTLYIDNDGVMTRKLIVKN